MPRVRARRKISQLEEALEGAEFFTAGHAALLATMLERIDRAGAEIAQLTGVIERLLAPYEEQLAQAESMPGWGRRSAQHALAETGADMSRFPAPARRDRRRGRPNPDPRRRPVPADCPKTWQGPSPGRPWQHPAEGLPQAPVLARTRYQDLGPDYYERQATTRRQIACRVGKLAALGFEVTLARISIPGLRRLSQQRSLTPGPNLHPAPLTLRRVLPRAQLISISG